MSRADGAGTDRQGNRMANIIVAGAGIVGVSAALWLQRAGHTVTLVDREGPASGTSHGNAGVLAAGAVIPVTTPGILRRAPGMLSGRDQPLFLRWRYLPRLLPFLRRYLAHATTTHVAHYATHMSMLLGDSLAQHRALSAATPAARFVHDDDYCFGYATEAEFAADAGGWAIRAAHGVASEVLRGADATAHDPLFGGAFVVVVRCKNHGRISDPGAYVQALAAHFAERGGTIVRTAITDVEVDGGAVQALTTDAGRMAADHIVLALGPWSGDIARKLGLKSLQFESERGYHIELMNPSAMPRAPMMVAAGKFVVTPMDGRIRCAGVIEFGGLGAGPSAAPFAMLRRHIARVLPGVTWEREVTWMGHRPAPADSLPLIGPLDPDGRGYAAFGHQHVGLTGGPKTGRIVADMISGTALNTDLSAFDPRRHA